MPILAATTTAEGVHQLKSLLLEVYLEQLYSRPQPTNRSVASFDSILRTAYRACENRLKELHTVPGVWAFASKCLRDREWKEKFQSQGAEICASNCISADLQQAFVNAVEEPPDFERSLNFTLQVFEHRLQAPVPEIDLDQTEPGAEPSTSSSVFQQPLRDAESVIDLD